MNILITNDDGVNAPGLLALAQEFRKFGNVTVFAPDKNWSASGHVKTMHRPLRVKTVRLADESEAYTSDGAPSDCVALAMLDLLSTKFDMVVSGINPHANLGHDVTYSGTVTAAMEAAIWGLPGFAVSLDSPEKFSEPLDYSTAARVAREVVERFVNRKIERDVVININVPYLSFEEIKGFHITRQGLRIYRDQLVSRKDPRGKPYYWIGGEVPSGIVEDGTDIGALAAGCVSITPLHLDLTSYRELEIIESWDW